ncbi:MAG: hypothetical protein ACTHKB_02570, partial [Burkholderiaceae bacterium]
VFAVVHRNRSDDTGGQVLQYANFPLRPPMKSGCTAIQTTPRKHPETDQYAERRCGLSMRWNASSIRQCAALPSSDSR